MSAALANLGHEVHVFTYHLGESTEEPFRIHRIPEVPNYQKTSPGPSWQKLLKMNPALVRLLREAAQEIGFDVVHAHHYEGISVASKACPDLPLVYDAHTTLSGELPDYSIGLPKSVKRAIGAVLDRKIPAKADYTISVSKSIREVLTEIKAVADDSISVIPNGVDPKLFQVSGDNDRTPNRIIFTGNTASYQRLDLLLESFVLVAEQRPQASLHFVGTSSFDHIHESIKKLGLSGNVETHEVAFSEECKRLSEASIAISPRTKCDGLPQKILNYMSAGTAIIACEGSAVHIRHEETGLRVPNDDPHALASAMIRLLDNPELGRKLAGAAQQEADSIYSWQAVARKVETCYHKAIERKKNA